MNQRTKDIKDKGFDMTRSGSDEYEIPARGEPLDFAKIKVGLKSLDNATANINIYKRINPKVDKENVLRAINQNNYEEMRLLSDIFYKSSGIYARLCRYMAYLYKYDWMVTPIILDTKIKSTKVLEGYYKSVAYLDNCNVKKILGEMALKAVRHGAYYGYMIDQGVRMVLQDLPAQYCRSRFTAEGRPVVEFNMRYFDNTFPDTIQRMQILKVFPTEFLKGYALYREGKLVPDFMGDDQGWYMLDYKKTVKFTFNNDDFPLLIATIPTLIDLEEAKELDRKKMLQQLLKIIIQEMPIDKNGELVFDVDEAQALHNNVVAMLGQAIGVDVLTTFAKVDVKDMSDRAATSVIDEVTKVERSVFNEAGVSQMQFNSTSNMALEKSVANDEASVSNLILQFEMFLNDLLAPFNTAPKKLSYRAQILGTTIYNYKAMADLYQKQMQTGFSKFLPQIAMGQSQSTILANAYFETEILDLNSLFVPPAMSSTTSAGKTPETPVTDKKPGRPALEPDQKTDKTIQNNETM